jgi:hypothetical protein
VRSRALLVLAGLGALALGLALVILLYGSDRHADGMGPLASLLDPATHQAMKVDPSSGDTAWTYGVPLCLFSGQTPAILESVTPTVTVGTGFRLLGIGVREFPASQTHTPIISVGGWPPLKSQVPDQIQPVQGFEVSTPCGQNPNTGRYTELLIGLERVGIDGGGWQGLEIGYTVGGRHRILAVRYDVEICGTRVSCEVPSSVQPVSKYQSGVGAPTLPVVTFLHHLELQI